MRVSSQDELVAEWRAAFAAAVPEGWDFSELDGRIEESEPPWSYARLAGDLAAGAGSVLDLGTGGGELLLRLADRLPADTHATEGWPPNVPVARAALAPHGIEVAEYDADRGDRLPYRDGRFDLVLSRHEAYSAAEVARVLRPGGHFLTQQVDGRNLVDLAELFGAGPAHPEVTPEALRAEAGHAGLEVELAREWTGPITFPDVTTLLSYLRMMPWQLPEDFSVDRYLSTLLALHATAGRPTFTEGRFLLRCRSESLSGSGRPRCGLARPRSRR